MKRTPEGMRAYKRQGVRNFNQIFTTTDGEARDSFVGSGLLASGLELIEGKDKLEAAIKRTASYTHVGECRPFTISRDSVSFNHNHEITYREGILQYERDKANRCDPGLSSII